MTPDLVGDVILATLYLAGFCAVITVGVFFADYVLPRFPKVERALFGLFGLDHYEFEDYYEKKGVVW